MIRYLLCLVLLTGGLYAHAGPGAHGPNGEHLEGQAAAGAAASAVPTMEAHTDTFELVGRLYDEEFSVMIDRFDTNAPILKATIEVELNGIKASSVFHADQGDYSFTDARLLKALALPGKHALVFTILAGTDSDLLEGSLVVGAAPAPEHGHSSYWWLIAAAALALALASLVAYASRRRLQFAVGRK